MEITRATSLIISVGGSLPSYRPPRAVVRHRSGGHRVVRCLLPLLRARRRGAVPAARQRSNDAAARAEHLHAADVAPDAISIAREAWRRAVGRRRCRTDHGTPDRLRVRHSRARHRSSDLRGFVPSGVRRREHVRATTVPARSCLAAGAGGPHVTMYGPGTEDGPGTRTEDGPGTRDRGRTGDQGPRTDRGPGTDQAPSTKHQGPKMTSTAVTAEALGIPETFNVATHFVDRNVEEGRGAHVAIECGDARVTYDEVLRSVNRFGSALRAIDVRPEERVLLLLLDGPDFVYSFFGAIKAGAVPIPLNTLWKPADYQHVIHDSRARVLIVSATLLPEIAKIPTGERRSLRHIYVVGSAESTGTHTGFDRLLAEGSPDLEAEPTSRDAPAFWLYSSGSTGAPKGCVHLHHDMVVCAELFGKGVLGIRASDRCFSVAKLFFAYGLGNGLYFPFGVGATTVLFGGPPTPANVFEIVNRHKPTLFFSVPTNYAMLLAQETQADFSSVRWGVSAGEALPPAIFERFEKRFGVKILDGIGS